MNDLESQRARILVVDDQRVHREKLVRAVRSLDHDAVAVNGGASALTHLRAERFDLVLLDILMPDMDGFEVMDFMQRDDKLRSIPVIVVSALESEMDSVVRAVEMGAEDMLPKHFDRVLLAARLDSALERHRVYSREREHREHMRRLTDAASLMEHHPDLPPGALLAQTCSRTDAIGQLARVFVHMSSEVHTRNAHFQRQLSLLRLVGLALAAGVVLGLATPLARVALLEQPKPLGIALWFGVICTLLSLPAALWRRGIPHWNRELGQLVITLTLAGAVGGTLPLLWLASLLPLSTIAILFPAEIAFVLVLSSLLNGQWPSTSRLLSAALAIAATALLAFGFQGLPPWTLDTLAVALIAPLGWAVCGRAIAKYATSQDTVQTDSLTIVGLVALLATVCIAPLVIILGEFVPLFQVSSFTEPGVQGSPVVAMGGNALGLVLVLLGAVVAAGATLRVLLAREGGAETAAASSVCMALATLGWSVLVLGESVPTGVWLPIMLFVAALLVRAVVVHRLQPFTRTTLDIELG